MSGSRSPRAAFFLEEPAPSFAMPAQGDSRDSPGESRHIDDSCRAAWFGYRLVALAQALDVESDGLTDLADRILLGRAGGYASGQTRNVGRVVPRRFLDDDRVANGSGHFAVSPACCMMLAHVPHVRSSFGLPATVTVPGLRGCQY